MRFNAGKLWLARVFIFCLACFVLFVPACRKRGTALLDQAQVAWDNGNFDVAAARYEDYLKEDIRSAQAETARFKLANLYLYNLKKYDLATQHYIHLLEDFPKFSENLLARERLSESYRGAKDNRAAIQELENLLIAKPDYADKRRIRLIIADLYFDLSEFGQALAEYDKVTVDSAFDELAQRAYLRMAGIHIIRDEFEAALQAYQRVAGQTGDSAIRRTARYGMADCYERTFKFDEAVKVLQETETDPKTPDYVAKRVAAVREQQRQRQIAAPNGTLNARRQG
jgi:tetratricopeptide (TPR) repeat protein